MIKDIVVVGGGTAGWMTAAALCRSLGTKNHTITVVESEQIGTVGVGEATIPPIMIYNNALGLDEVEFVKETKATFKLGIEFVNWRKKDHSYFHPFGMFGSDMDGISFMHFWLRWKKKHGNLDYLSFNAEACAARERKFAWIKNEPGPKMLPDVNYAYHFDAILYGQFLRRFSEKYGGKRVEGKVVAVNQNSETGFIESISLENGQTIKGDLFVDCTGFKGLLIEETLKAGYLNWSHWLPVDSAAAVPCESKGELLPYTRSIAKDSGWQWRIPLQHRTGNGYVYSSQYCSDDEAKNVLLDGLDGEPLADVKLLKFVTGVRKQAWVKNCIAIGLSSGFLEPLESTSIHLIQRAIHKLLAMFPTNEIDPHLVNKFNQQMFNEYNEVKDFLIAHYCVTEREDTPFWQYVKNMEIPDSLQERLEIFKGRGEVIVQKDELFREASWFAVLMGQGIEPQGYHPIADVISDDQLQLRLTKIRSAIMQRVKMLPLHGDFVRQYCSSAPW